MSGYSLHSIFLPSRKRDPLFDQFRALATRASDYVPTIPSSPPTALMPPPLPHDMSEPGAFFTREDSSQSIDQIASTPLDGSGHHFHNAIDRETFSMASSRTIGRTPPDYNDLILDNDMILSDDDEPQPTPVPNQSKSHIENNPAKKARPRSVTSSKQMAASEEEYAVQPRQMRKRTLRQTRPYLADKIQHQKSQKAGKGRAIGENEVEEEIEATQRGPKRVKAARKGSADNDTFKARVCKTRDSKGRFSSTETVTSSRTSSSARTPDPKAASGPSEEMMQKTTLMVWLKGDDDGAAPIPLADCRSVAELFNHIEATWGDGQRKQVKQVQCIFPWLTEEDNLIIRAKMHHSFQRLMDNVGKAPVWRKKGDRELKLKMVATME